MTGRTGAPPPAPEPLRVPVVDTHTHLDLQGGDVPAAVRAAAEVGVSTLVQVGTDVASSRWSAQVAGEHAQVWATVAVHPNDAPRLPDLAEALAEIDRLAALPQVRGVGETGLDHYRTPPAGRGVQEESFRRHVDIARRHAKTLVVHDRDAHDDVLRVLADEAPPPRVVFHCFSGDAAMVRRCADAGYFVSFAGNVTFRNAEPLREALAAAPADLLLVETDAPFLTPMPYRGRPNAPYLVPLTVRAMAAVRGVSEDVLAGALGENARRAFAL